MREREMVMRNVQEMGGSLSPLQSSDKHKPKYVYKTVEELKVGLLI